LESSGSCIFLPMRNGSVKIGSVNSIRFESASAPSVNCDRQLETIDARNRPQSNTESVMSGMCEAVIP